jgi:hypothetical protein
VQGPNIQHEIAACSRKQQEGGWSNSNKRAAKYLNKPQRESNMLSSIAPKTVLQIQML